MDAAEECRRFLIRQFEWAKDLLISQSEAGFPLLAEIQSGGIQSVLKLLESLQRRGWEPLVTADAKFQALDQRLRGDMSPLLMAMVRRPSRWALATDGRPLTDEENEMLKQFDYASDLLRSAKWDLLPVELRASFKGRESAALGDLPPDALSDPVYKGTVLPATSKSLKTVLKDALKTTFRHRPNSGKRELGLRMQFGQWRVETDIDFGRPAAQFGYYHAVSLMPPRDKNQHGYIAYRPAVPFSLPALLGFGPAEWDLVTADNVDKAARSFLRLCECYLDAFPTSIPSPAAQ